MRIFLATHGKMASGIKNTLDILLGDSSKLVVFDAYLDESSVDEVVQEFLLTVDESETVLLLSDIFGGSVNQVLLQNSVRANTYLVAGVNLPFVLDMMLKDTVDAEIIDNSIEESRNALQRVEVAKLEVVEDEDFF